jgi:hypothetical protein
MAYASVTYTSASGTTFALTNSSGDPIPYLRQSDISVTVNGVLKTLTTDYTFNTAGTSIVLNTAVSGVSVVIARVTDIADATVTYTAGSTLTAQDLNNADNQIRYGLQEFSDTYGALTTGTGDLSALAGFIGSTETWTSDNAHTATTGAIDNRVDSKITTNNATVVLRDGSQAMQAALSLGGFKVTNLATPTSNTDASTKAYVDSNVGSVSASATAAAASASAAATSASNASTSASAASASQSAAASSASSASTSASNASTSASSASTSASNASTSATNAATSATSAASSAASALAAFDSFDDRYLGSKASDPTVDNDGDPLNAGDLYYNTTLSIMKVYTGTAWVAAYVPGDAVNISFTPYSTIAATNVQNAVQELTDEKLNLTGGTLTGALVNPLGSAAAPSLTFTGDTNTGIYSPGADQVAITTGGTGRLFIDSSGRLLAGTSTARTNFFGTTLSAVIQTEGTGGSTGRGALSVINNDVSNNPPYVLLGRSGAATLGSNAVVVSGSRLGTLTFHGADGTSFIEAATVAGEVDGTPGTNDMPGRLVFSTTADGAASPTERLRIDSTGQIQAASLGTAAAPIYSFLNDPNTGIYSPGADQVAISTGGSGRLFIDASGNVGVGVSPTNASGYSTLDINNATNGGRLRFLVNGTAYGQIYNNAATDFRCGTVANVPFHLISNASIALTVDTSQRVGVGTSSPNNKFTLQDGSVLVRSEVTTGTSNSHNIGFSATSTGGVAATISSYRENANEASALTFNTWNGSAFGERMRVSASGSVGIGTSPSYKLHVSGNNAVSADNTIAMSYGRAANPTDALHKITWGSDDLRIEADTANTIASNITFTNDGSERARIDSSGRLLVGTSSASDASKFVVQGQVSANAGQMSVRRNAVGADSAILGSIDFDDSSASLGARIQAVGDATWGTNDYPTRLTFSTTADGASGPTERMRIKSDGQLNTLSSVGGFYSTVTAAAGTTIPTFAGRRSGTTLDNGTDTCYIWSNGNIQNVNGSYTAISDQKLKENIADANSQWNDFKAIQIRNWNFKEETGHETHRQIGPIAQELEQVCPGLVFETPDRDADGNETGEVTKGVNQSVLYMKAVKALQEAMERIEQLESKVAALESA